MSSCLPSQLHCDVFCNVIDNFGDAGVCWRLVRELAAVTDWKLRLVTDRPELIDRLRANDGEGPEVVAWGTELDRAEVADVVIEAFGCRLPEAYLGQMRRREKSPVWVNLEYLSAEAWIDGCHGLPSPDPQSGIAKYFFFPGFSAKNGGLIRERRVDTLLAEMKDPAIRAAWLKSIGVDASADCCLVSLFCYADSPFGPLFNSWRHSARPVHCLLADGLPQSQLQKIQDHATAAGVRVSRLPFLPQDHYDRLLAACDVNFVRGEDSFVRAQWFANPFAWQAYRQSEETHLEKLAAFLDRYLAKMPSDAAAAVRSLHEAWNGGQVWPESLWLEFIAKRGAIEQHNREWSKSLGSHGNLAENLAVFCRSKL